MKRHRFNRRIVDCLIVLALFGVAVAAVSVYAGNSDRVRADQNLFHLDAIRQFARQWPRPDLHDYASATTPGYHLLLAAVSHYASDDVNVLRVFGGTFGVALVALMAAAASRRSAWLAMPLAMSWYVLTSTTNLLPEDAAWLGVAGALLLAMYAEGVAFYAGSAVVLALLVLFRQSTIWVNAAFVAGAFARYLDRREQDSPDDGRRTQGTISSAVTTAASVLPAVAVLLVFVALWHGLTPPSFQPGSGINRPMATKVGGFAPAGPATLLTLMAVFGVPLLGWLWPDGDRRRPVRFAVIGLAIGFVLGILPPTEYLPPDRRTGFWAVVAHVPSFAARSPLVVALSTLGGGVVAVALLRLRPRERWVMATAVAAFTLAQMGTSQLWQRYYEPFALLWLTLAAAGGEPDRVPIPPSRRLVRYTGLAGVTALQVAAVAYRLRHPE